MKKHINSICEILTEPHCISRLGNLILSFPGLLMSYLAMDCIPKLPVCKGLQDTKYLQIIKENHCPISITKKIIFILYRALASQGFLWKDWQWETLEEAGFFVSKNGANLVKLKGAMGHMSKKKKALELKLEELIVSQFKRESCAKMALIGWD